MPGMRRQDSQISLRRHYPDQVQRVGTSVPSQPHGSPLFIAPSVAHSPEPAPPALQSNPRTVGASTIRPSYTMRKATPKGNSTTLINSVGSGRGPRSSLIAPHRKRWQTSVLRPVLVCTGPDAPSVGPVARLLEELPTGRMLRLLTGIDTATRQLQRERAQRLPPLPHEHHVSSAGYRHDGREPTALEDTVLDPRSTRQFDPSTRRRTAGSCRGSPVRAYASYHLACGGV